MGLWSWVGIRKTQSEELAVAADHVVRVCMPVAWEQCSDRLSKMTIHESRGYVRARTGAMVRENVQRVAQSNSVLTRGIALLRARVEEKLLAELVQRVRTSTRSWRKAA